MPSTKQIGVIGVATLLVLTTCLAVPPVGAQPLRSAADAAEPDAWFPRIRTSQAGSVVVYAPQIDAWQDFSDLSAWIAFEVTPAGSDHASFGSLHFKGRTEIDLEAREVLLVEPELLELSIQGVAEDAIEYELVRNALRAQPINVPLDLVLAYVPRALALPSTEGMNSAPPQIFTASSSALLLAVDAEPLWLPVEGTNLEFVVNANWDLLREQAADRVYLRFEQNWLTARGLDRRWTWARSLPASLSALPRDGYWTDVVESLPSKLSSVAEPDRNPPQVFYATGPAELIQFEGDPDWRRLVGTQLEYAINSPQEVFRAGNMLFLLLSGRWFEAADFDGAWSLAEALPEVFAQIPGDHAKSYVRASVPGTVEAWEAALIASIPRKATLDREVAEYAPSVTYAGEPAFQPIDGTDLAMAMNTSFQVLQHDHEYYLCHDAIWFESSSAMGRYGESVVGYGPYGAARSTTVYNPTTGTYARGQAFWDSDEYAGRGYAYNPNTGTSIAGNRYHDFEDREGWSQRVVTRGDEWRYKQSQWSDGQMLTEFESSRGTQGQVNRTVDGDTLTSTGTIQRGEQQASFESTRARQGDALVSDGTITGAERSASFESTFQDGAGEISIVGSEGGSGQFTREGGDGEITGSGTIARNSESIDTETRRTAEGVQRSFETTSGGQGTVVNQGGERTFAGETSGGDVYAGRDGEVYKRTDDGWSKVENPGGGTSAQGSDRGTQPREFATTQAGESRFGQSQTGQRNSPFPTSRLERDFESRSRGYERYGNYQRGGTSARGGLNQGRASRGAAPQRR